MISFCFLNAFLGGIIGCIIGGHITQYYHPKYAFLIYSFVGLIVSGCAIFLKEEKED